MLPDKILIDEDKIKEIVLNLLSNAVKYTEEGVVTFSVVYLNNKIIFILSE